MSVMDTLLFPGKLVQGSQRGVRWAGMRGLYIKMIALEILPLPSLISSTQSVHRKYLSIHQK